jgi:hypothetical protein
MFLSEYIIPGSRTFEEKDRVRLLFWQALRVKGIITQAKYWVVTISFKKFTGITATSFTKWP